MDWLDLLAVQGTLKSLLQHHSSKASGGPVIKNPLAKVGDTGDMGSIPGLGRSPGEGNGKPLQYSFLGNPSLSGYSLWVHEESDMPEHAHMSFFAPEIEE